MTDILDNPFGFNKDYDINLKEVCSCLFKSEGTLFSDVGAQHLEVFYDHSGAVLVNVQEIS